MGEKAFHVFLMYLFVMAFLVLTGNSPLVLMIAEYLADSHGEYFDWLLKLRGTL